tara:strand:+ start:664 stop:2667 length:2004 start_codon:yes stop_codon:yes gene_type:complete
MEPELDRFGNPYDSSEDELDRFGNPYDSAELPQEFKAPEKQRIRNLLQGATFNTADEAEALATSLLTDRTYEESLQDIRAKLSSSQENFAGSSAVSQMGGALIPSAAAFILSRGKIKPEAFNSAQQSAVFQRYLPNLAKVFGIGAAESAAAGFGAGEGGFENRIEGMTGEAGVGGGLSVALNVAGGATLKTLSGLVSALRRAGSPVSEDVVKREIQRIVREMERPEGGSYTPDEVVEMLASGKILSDNPSVAAELRALRSEGGIEGAFVKETEDGASFVNRPSRTRAEASETIQEGLAAGTERNTVRLARASEKELKTVVSKAYKAIKQVEASGPVYQAMRSVLMRSKSSLSKINSAYRSETGKAPFFKFNEELDRFEFDRAPTNMEAEYLRRIIDQEADGLIAKGGADGLIGINYKSAADDLRSAIDNEYDDIVSARATAANAFNINDAFKAGQRNSNFDVSEDAWLTILEKGNAEEIASFRLGYLAKIKSRLGTGNKQNFIKNLLSPENDTGRLFQSIFPEDKLDDALRKLDIAASAGEAYSKVYGGSQTANILRTAARQGKTSEAISTGKLAIMAPTDLMATAGLIDRMVSAFAPRLTIRQKNKIAETLVSDNADVVFSALNDNTAMRELQIIIAKAAGIPLQAAATAVGSETSANLIGNEGEQ